MAIGGGQVVATPTVVLGGDSEAFKAMIAGAQRDLMAAGQTMTQTADRVSAQVSGGLGRTIQLESASMSAFGQQATFAADGVGKIVPPARNAAQHIAGLDALARHAGVEMGVGMARGAIIAGQSLNEVVESMKKAAATGGGVFAAGLGAAKTAMSALTTAGGLLVVGLIAIELWNKHLEDEYGKMAEASDRAAASADKMRESIHQGIIVAQDNARALALVNQELAAFQRGGKPAAQGVEDLGRAFDTAKAQWMSITKSTVAVSDATLLADDYFLGLMATQYNLITAGRKLSQQDELAAQRAAIRADRIEQLVNAGARQLAAEQGVGRAISEYTDKTVAATHPTDALTQAMRDELKEFEMLAMTAAVYGLNIDKATAAHNKLMLSLAEQKAGADTKSDQGKLDTLHPAMTPEQIQAAWDAERAASNKAVDDMIAKLGEFGPAAQNIAQEGIAAFVDFSLGAGDAMSQFAHQAVAELERVLIKLALIKAAEFFFPGGGTILSALGLTARASGGPVYAGHPYLVGEQGPELFMPSSAGQIIANPGGSSGAAAPELPPYPRAMSPEALAVDDWWRRKFSASMRDYQARGGRVR